jgi:hypothetical protein
MCITKDNLYPSEIFFAFLTHPLTKTCKFYKHSDIDDIIYEDSLNQISILISEQVEKEEIIGGLEFIAIKIVLYERVSSSKDPKHKFLNLSPRDHAEKYDRVKFQLADIQEIQQKKIQVKNYSATSIGVKILGITFPRLVMILTLTFGYFLLHLDMREQLYPLQHIMFALNMIFVFLMIDGLLKLESLMFSSIFLAIFLVAGFFGILLLKIKWIYRVTLMSNVIVLYELYVETIDYFSSFFQFLMYTGTLLMVLFLIGCCVKCCSFRNVTNDRIKSTKLIHMKRELFIGALLTIKLFVYDARKPVTNFYRVFYMFFSIIFVTVVFVLRTLVVIYWKRKKEQGKLDKEELDSYS